MSDGEGVNEQIHEEFLAIINSECDRLTRLINDVLDLAWMARDFTVFPARYHWTWQARWFS